MIPFAVTLYYLFNPNGKSNLTLYFIVRIVIVSIGGREGMNVTMNIVDKSEENSYFNGIIIDFTESSPFSVKEHKIHPT